MRLFLCGSALMMATSTPASAFDLFGYHLFGAEKETTGDATANPLPYEAELTLADKDTLAQQDEPDQAKDLKKALEATSLLVSTIKDKPSGEAGLIARALNDRDRLVARLYTFGRYGGVVRITLNGRSLQDTLNDGKIPGARPVKAAISVTAGPLFHFGKITINAPKVATAAATTETAADTTSYGLKQGDEALSGKILAAEQRLLRSLRRAGYPKAQLADRDIVADHASKTVDVTLTAVSGPKATFGTVNVTGAKRTDTDFIIRQAMIPQGQPYSPQTLQQAQSRLNKLGIFSSIQMVEADKVAPDGSLPITIEVSERKRHVVGAGASWSSTDGLGLEAYWTKRNLFGKAESLTVSGTVGEIGASDASQMEYSTKIAFEKPGAFGPLTTFTTSIGAKQEAPDAYTSRSVTWDAYLSRQFTKTTSVKGGTEISFLHEEDAFGVNSYLLTGVPGTLTFDNRDDILNPTKGFYATAFAEPAYDALNGNGMVFLKGSASTYAALDNARRFVLAGKLTVGSIVAPSVESVPASRRFIAGGGGSIRGYSYRNVGPRVDGQVVGGRSLVEMSGELRVKITDKIGVVGFADAGNVYSDIVPDFSNPFKIGVGAGIRYFTPIGPLRIDAALPLEPEEDDPDYAIYVGLSQAF